MAFGLTPTGFVAKKSEDILAEIETSQLGDVDQTLDLSPDQPLGQFNGIFASELATAWEILDTIYSALDPDNAEGAQLDNAAALTGTTRLGPSKSTVLASVNINANKTFAPGTMTSTPTGQPALLFRNRDTVVSVLAGTYSAYFEAVDYGPIAANAGTLTVITTAVSGWNSITNATDASPGRLVEGDSAYRLRRRVELTKGGSCTVDAIRADLLDPKSVPGVISAVVIENTSMTIDGNGLPPKSFQSIIWDGVVPLAADTRIAQAIWDTKPSGIETYGSTTANATDSLGVLRPVKFSRATQRAIYLSYNIIKDVTKYPADGDTQLKNAAIALGAKLQLGDDVISLAFRAVALTVAGVIDVYSFTLDFTPSPAPSTNLTIGATEIATFDTGRIVVT